MASMSRLRQGIEARFDHATAKQKLTAQLEAARGLADTLLHSLRHESAKSTFDEWCDSHQPFHWFVEFPSVWRSGGFDAVIGNPPYIKINEVTDYSWLGYRTQLCPNLYAACVERASSLLNSDGRLSMVVMHSLCFNKSFFPLRDHLADQFGSIWISSYSRASDSLFSGSAKVRNSIVIASSNGTKGMFSTQCHRWFASSRPNV